MGKIHCDQEGAIRRGMSIATADTTISQFSPRQGRSWQLGTKLLYLPILKGKDVTDQPSQAVRPHLQPPTILQYLPDTSIYAQANHQLEPSIFSPKKIRSKHVPLGHALKVSRLLPFSVVTFDNTAKDESRVSELSSLYWAGESQKQEQQEISKTFDLCDENHDAMSIQSYGHRDPPAQHL